MPKIKPIIAGTPEDLADALGLPRVAAEEWQFQHVLLARLKEIARRKKLTHSEIAKLAGTSRTRVTSILNNDLEHVSSDLMIRILASLGYRVKVSVVRSNEAAWLWQELRRPGRVPRPWRRPLVLPARRLQRDAPSGPVRQRRTPLSIPGKTRVRHP